MNKFWAKVKNVFVEKDSMAKPLQRGKGPFIFFMVIITILNFLVFYVAVNINSFVLAFQEYIGKGAYKISLSQFQNVFENIRIGLFGTLEEKLAQEGSVIVGFENTMMYFWSNLLISLPLSFFASYFIYKKVVAYRFFRVIFFMPSIISQVVLVLVYKNLIIPGGGLENMFGISLGEVMGSRKSANITMLIYCLWTAFGTDMILYQGAMKRIPESVIEAAKLDGVGPAGEMFKIITPLVWPTVMTTITVAFSSFMTASGPILLFTKGSQNTHTISYLLFDKVKYAGETNYAAALGLVCTFVAIPVVFFSRWVLSKLFETVEY